MLNQIAYKNLPNSVKKLFNLIENISEIELKTAINYLKKGKSDNKISKYLNFLISFHKKVNEEKNWLPERVEDDFYLQILRHKLITSKDLIRRSIDISTLSTLTLDRILNLLQVEDKNMKGRSQLYQQLRVIEFLYRKKQFELCSELIEEAEELAEKLENHSILLEICYYRKKLQAHSSSKINEYEKSYADIHDKERKSITSLSVINVLSVLYHKTLFLTWNNNLSEQQHNELGIEIKVRTESLESPIESEFEFQNYFHNIKKNYYLLKKDLNDSEIDALFDEFLAIDAIFQDTKYSMIKENDYERYLYHYHNFLTVCIKFQRLEKLPVKNFTPFVEYYKKNNSFVNMFFINNIINLTDIYTSNWNEAKKRIDIQNQSELIKILCNNRNKLTTTHYIAVAYNYLLINFVTNDTEKALAWSEVILDENFKEINIEYIILSKYIQVVLMHQCKHNNLDTTLRSIKEYSKRHEKHESIHTCLQKCFNNYLLRPDIKKLKEYKTDLIDLIEADHTLKTYRLFVAWMDSEIARKPIMETIKNFL